MIVTSDAEEVWFHGAEGSVPPDFYGLGVGSEWEYELTLLGSQPQLGTLKVIEKHDHDGHTVYKYGDPSGSGGSFFGRVGDTYYEFGTWSNDPESPEYPEHWHEDRRVVVTDPVTVGTPGFGATAIEREIIETPAGTFDAWVFHDESVLDGEAWLSKQEFTCWFAPYVGVVTVLERIATMDLYTGDVNVEWARLLELQHYTIATP